jgi:hypothetical protein
MRMSGASTADRVQAESDRLYGIVSIALYSAAAMVLERRSEEAFRGWRTKAALAVAAVGIAGTFGLADYFKSQRDLGTLRAACIQAEAQGATNACAPFESKSELQTARLQAAAVAAAATVTTLEQAARAKLSPEQKQILARFAKCTTAVAQLPATKSLSDASKQEAAALCATSG